VCVCTSNEVTGENLREGCVRVKYLLISHTKIHRVKDDLGMTAHVGLRAIVAWKECCFVLDCYKKRNEY
jgi:hypothetical protein